MQNQVGDADKPIEDERSATSFLYRFRGIILAVLAIAVLAFPPADLSVVPFLLFISIFTIAIFLRVKARRAIGDHTRGDAQQAPVLVTWGAYGYLRHPLYVSNMAIGLGLIVYHLGLNWPVIPFAAFLVAYDLKLAKLDDVYLEKRYGEEWRLWAAKTPAFIPRDNHVTGELRSAKEAIVGDTCTWIWLALIVALVSFRKVGL